MSERFHNLCKQIVELCGEMSREATASNPNLWAETRGMEAVKRAIVVAAVAHTPVLFIGPNAELAQMLAMQAGVPAGVFTEDLTGEGKQYVLRRLSQAMKKYPMHCEAPAVPVKGTRGNTSSLQEAVAQASAVRLKMPKTLDLTDTANGLWKQACSELALSNELTRKSIVSVACSIAALNGNSVIDTADITEALYYWLDRR